jgi:hypothetical protein
MSWLVCAKGKRVCRWQRWGCKVRRSRKPVRGNPYTWVLLFTRHLYLVDYRPWRGHHVRARYELEDPQHAARVPTWVREEPSVKRKVVKAEEARPVSLARLDNPEMPVMDPISEHMATITYDDGGARKAGLVLLLVNGAEYTALAKDPDSAMQLRARGSTLYEALETLAVLLSQADAPWEPDTYQATKSGPRKSK